MKGAASDAKKEMQAAGFHVQSRNNPPATMKSSIAAFCCVCLTGCQCPKPHTEPGIQPIEAAILTKQYYWRKDRDPKQYSDTQIQAFFARSEEVHLLDGERAELHMSMLRYALAAAGDKHYAALLAQESLERQQAVAQFLHRPLSFGGLHYPMTEALLNELPSIPNPTIE